MSLLNVNDLQVEFQTADGCVQAVQNVSFRIEEGQTLTIVGESGSGKSQSAFAIMGLLAHNGNSSGSVQLDNQEILNLPEPEMNQIRARKMAMIFQDPMTALNPYMKISNQMVEVLTHHQGLGKKEALAECIRMLDAVKIPEARSRIYRYPHEFSGGMRQRVLIAMALLCRPRVLIADEPTTALDVTVQAQILALLREIQEELHTAIILITHNMGVVAGVGDNTLVMYGGRVMEYGRTDTLFASPSHPYTRGLLHAIPRLDHEGDRLTTIPGNPPDMMNMPEGCPFSERCGFVRPNCSNTLPELEPVNGTDHWRACLAPVEQLH